MEDDLTLLTLADALSGVKFTEDNVLPAMQAAVSQSAVLIRTEHRVGRYQVWSVITHDDGVWALDLQIFDTHFRPSPEKGHVVKLVNANVLLTTQVGLLINKSHQGYPTFDLQEPRQLINSSLRLVL